MVRLNPETNQILVEFDGAYYKDWGFVAQLLDMGKEECRFMLNMQKAEFIQMQKQQAMQAQIAAAQQAAQVADEIKKKIVQGR
jgi:hypothetical protein